MLALVCLPDGSLSAEQFLGLPGACVALRGLLGVCQVGLGGQEFVYIYARWTVAGQGLTSARGSMPGKSAYICQDLLCLPDGP